MCGGAILILGVICSAPGTATADPAEDLVRRWPETIDVMVGEERLRLPRNRRGPVPPSLQPVVVGGQVVDISGNDVVDGRVRPLFPRRLYIVTTDDIARESRSLQKYMRWRKAGGWEVISATEEQWNVSVDEDGDDRAARIRGWLKGQYRQRGAGYLLLVGHPLAEDGVPMRITQPLSDALLEGAAGDTISNVPTDYYYADLLSDWDCDGDGVFGRFPFDVGPGCLDMGPELLVGRIPVYKDVEEADRVFDATLAYELSEDKTHRLGALFAGAFGGFAGQTAVGGGLYHTTWDLADFLAYTAEELDRDDRAKITRLFEAEGVMKSSFQYELPLERDVLIDEWSLGYGTVAWGGHGLAQGSYRAVWTDDRNRNGRAENSEVQTPEFIGTRDAFALAEAPSTIVFMMSCLNGRPEDSRNLASSLLGRGAVATVAATRSAVGVTDAGDWVPRPRLADATNVAYYFVSQVWRGSRVGDALAYTKWALPGDGWRMYEGSNLYEGYTWLTRFEFNLFGDPTVSLELCDADGDCDDGLPCTGIETCREGVCIHTDPVVCEDVGQCAESWCDNATGACRVVNLDDGAACDDGSFCTEPDVCRAGVCESGPPRDCGGDEDYAAECDEVTNSCVWIPKKNDDADSVTGAGPSVLSESTGAAGCVHLPVKREIGVLRALEMLL